MSDQLSQNECNPGSFNQFVAVNGIDPNLPDAWQLHSRALAEYRQLLADRSGITTEELHMLGRYSVGFTEAA